MEQKLLFFDIDGTLAMPGHPPAEADVEAIRRARLLLWGDRPDPGDPGGGDASLGQAPAL